MLLLHSCLKGLPYITHVQFLFYLLVVPSNSVCTCTLMSPTHFLMQSHSARELIFHLIHCVQMTESTPPTLCKTSYVKIAIIICITVYINVLAGLETIECQVHLLIQATVNTSILWLVVNKLKLKGHKVYYCKYYTKSVERNYNALFYIIHKLSQSQAIIFWLWLPLNYYSFMKKV